jgi:hypothetical protein
MHACTHKHILAGHPVKSITRLRQGPIRLKQLLPGEWRPLSVGEVTDNFNLLNFLRNYSVKASVFSLFSLV